PHKETSAGQRKRHIIIFNPEIMSEISINLSFLIEGEDKSLQSKNFTVVPDSNVQSSVARTNINIVLNIKNQEPTFVKMNYKHNGKSSIGCELNVAILPLSSDSCLFLEEDYYIDTKNKVINIQTDK
ncbi:hypothetical protein, partial [Mycobacterium tuberculosis]|uniref:hypothetical protein n=1 Tax=Mycobacterium tuberculosis TaxID=1773 RepID=UPI001587B7E8